jgi:dephospho-CoA kinase
MVIGVTGNTGTGKSEICKLFKEWGATLISCDELGWEILKEPLIIDKIKDKFEGVIEKVTVNKEKLASVVFNNPDKLKQLNEIVHPELLKRLKTSIEKTREKIIVVDAALIFEWKIENWFDFIILLTSTPEDKHRRLKKQGIPEEIINGRLNSQGNSNHFIKFSDFIIENDGNLESLKVNARWVWDKIVTKKKD